MNFPKLVLSAVVALAFLTATGVLLEPLVFPAPAAGDSVAARTDTLFPFRFLAWLVTAGLLSYIFPIGYRGGVPWAEGLRFGMLMGVLAGLPRALHAYADVDTAFSGLLTVVLWNVITWGIAGALIGAVYGPALASRRD